MTEARGNERVCVIKKLKPGDGLKAKDKDECRERRVRTRTICVKK